MVIALVALVVICVAYVLVSTNKDSYTILKEDVNNSCSENGLSTAVAQKIIEIKIPTNEVDEYLKNAVQDGRCVYRDSKQ